MTALCEVSWYKKTNVIVASSWSLYSWGRGVVWCAEENKQVNNLITNYTFKKKKIRWEDVRGRASCRWGFRESVLKERTVKVNLRDAEDKWLWKMRENKDLVLTVQAKIPWRRARSVQRTVQRLMWWSKVRKGEKGWDGTEAVARLPGGFYLRETTGECSKQDRAYVQDKADCAVALFSFGNSF